MSHTQRNRKSAPKGWVVRDDGFPYRNGIRFGGGYEGDVPPYRCSRYRRENTGYRRATLSQYKAQVKNLMRHGRFEEILPFTRTSGWETW